jgi:mRNA interferase MazF
MVCKRYDIRRVELDPARASELRKTRPAVIVSLDVLNRVLETVVVCPLTSQLHPAWRTRLSVKIAGKNAEIAADQIRTINSYH